MKKIREDDIKNIAEDVFLYRRARFIETPRGYRGTDYDRMIARAFLKDYMTDRNIELLAWLEDYFGNVKNP